MSIIQELQEMIESAEKEVESHEVMMDIVMELVSRVVKNVRVRETGLTRKEMSMHTETKCKGCDMNFDTRIDFIGHCQQVHKMKLKKKSGGLHPTFPTPAPVSTPIPIPTPAPAPNPTKALVVTKKVRVRLARLVYKTRSCRVSLTNCLVSAPASSQPLPLNLPKRGLPIEVMRRVRSWFGPDSSVSQCMELASKDSEFAQLWGQLVDSRGGSREKANQVIRSYLTTSGVRRGQKLSQDEKSVLVTVMKNYPITQAGCLAAAEADVQFKKVWEGIVARMWGDIKRAQNSVYKICKNN